MHSLAFELSLNQWKTDGLNAWVILNHELLKSWWNSSFEAPVCSIMCLYLSVVRQPSSSSSSRVCKHACTQLLTSNQQEEEQASRRHRKRCTLRPPEGAVWRTGRHLVALVHKRCKVHSRLYRVSQTERAATSRRAAVEHRAEDAVSSVSNLAQSVEGTQQVLDRWYTATREDEAMETEEELFSTEKSRCDAGRGKESSNVCVTGESEEMYLLPVPSLWETLNYNCCVVCMVVLV